jgi:hypothetical protein
MLDQTTQALPDDARADVPCLTKPAGALSPSLSRSAAQPGSIAGFFRALVAAGVASGVSGGRGQGRPRAIAGAGRRPEGFIASLPTGPGTTPAQFFTAVAALEGASITAFAILAAELAHHGAPTTLVWRARAAVRQEGRHFRLTDRLARRFGGAPVPCPRLPIPQPRSLGALALENVTEGCVSETFAAATALWQAATARDHEVRAVMAAIAEDELSHAQLSWEVHAWASERLGPAITHNLVRARAAAAERLRAGCAAPVDPDLVARVGVPSPAAAAWLMARAGELWAEDARRVFS